MRIALAALAGLFLLSAAASAPAQPYGLPPPPGDRPHRCDGERDWGDQQVGRLSFAALNERIDADLHSGVFDHKAEHKLHDRMKKLSGIEARFCAKGFVTPGEYQDLRDRYHGVAIAIDRAEHHAEWEHDFDRDGARY